MRKILTGVAAVGVLAFCVAASAAPRGDDGYTLPETLQGRARVVHVQTPSLVNPGGRDANAQAEMPIHPSNIMVEVINDEAVDRGLTATGPGPEAVVFSQMYDCGRGWFLDNTPGTVEWHRMIFGNGFAPGGELSAFSAVVFISSSNFGAFNGTGGMTLELWDGDPYGLQDTTCSAGGVPAVVPGTTCSWSNLPEGVVYNLKCVFPAKISYPHQQAFGVIWPHDVCRFAWRLSEGYYTGGAINSPQVGDGDAMGMVWSDDQMGACATPSGYDVGFCCDDIAGDPFQGGASPVACDHTAVCSGDPLMCSNGMGSCAVDGDCWTPAGGCNPTGMAAHPTFCDDGYIEYFSAYQDEAPIYYNNFVGQAFARTNTIIQVVPVSVDAPPPNTPSDVTIDGNTLTIDQGAPGYERHMWFEVLSSDWDPLSAGLTIKAWQVGLDASGYSAGLKCTLTPWQIPCTDDSQCIAAFGPVGAGPLKGGCNVAGAPPDVCTAAYSIEERADFIAPGITVLGGADVSTLNYRYAAAPLMGSVPSAHIGNVYIGTLVLRTMCDCPKGTFNIGVMLPNLNTSLVQGPPNDNQFIPLLGVVGADIDFPTGQCCEIAPTIQCLSDTVTRCECDQLGDSLGVTTYFDSTKTCADDCIQCIGDDHAMCADDDACTVDRCVDMFCVNTPVAIPAGHCCDYTVAVPESDEDINGEGEITPNTDYTVGGDDDGMPEECTDDLCSDPDARTSCGTACGVPYNPPVADGTACSDEVPCLSVLDECLSGLCVGTDILTVPCTTNEECEDITEGLGSCNFVTGFCRCVPPSLNFDIHPSQKPNDACYLVGEPVTVDVYFTDVPVIVNGGQFVVNYDPTCLAFESIVPGGDPYVFEIAEMVDEGAGSIFYAVGVDPFGGGGLMTEGILATITFTKIGVCETCNMCFGGENPLNTYLVDNVGWMVADVELKCSDDVMENDFLGIDVPDDVVMNVNSCDSDTAFIYWDTPTVTSSCYEADLVCVGPWAPGDPHYVDPMTGGEIPVGTWTFSCSAVSTVCGDSVDGDWTVTVNDEVSLDVTLQVSPVILADELLRCIKFELFQDCVQDPLILERDIMLGGLWDHLGHFTEAIKVPADGNWICITARDQLHTLRACDYLECADGVYTATFKGDPFFGGNWLIGGNLDGFKKDIPTASHDVIDILDFGQFVANFGAVYGDPPTGDTPCGTQGPHADINGDGIVDALDFTFVTMNFLASSKECCCGGVVAGAPTLEISVEDLRANGMGDLSVGDLNRDGVLNATDMTDFMNGVRPTTKGSRDRAGSSLR